MGQAQVQVYDETSLKALGTEFRSMAVLSDAIEQKLSDNPSFPLRVPLSVVIDYKGVRAFALAVPAEKHMAVGPNEA